MQQAFESTRPARRNLRREVLRFLLVGFLNTGVTFALYWLLLRVMDYRLAYTTSYLSGIAISYFMNSVIVFNAKPNLKSAMAYPLVYATQYLVGLGVLWLWVSKMNMPEPTGVVVVAAMTLPLTFAISRLVLKRIR